MGNHVGELEPQVMHETTMNPETRELIQVTVHSAKAMVNTLETWMGTAVDGRKEVISTELNRYESDLD